MSDKTKKGVKPEELADEALKDVQGGGRTATTKTTQKIVRQVVKPIGGDGETPPLPVGYTLDDIVE